MRKCILPVVASSVLIVLACNGEWIVFPDMGCEEGEPCDICGDEVENDDVVINGDIGIDALGETTWFKGKLLLEGTEYSDLTILSKVQCVSNFEIADNNQLKSFSGLKALIRISGRWTIVSNESLEELSGPIYIKEVLNGIEIANNQSLESLHGLNAIKWIKGKFEVTDNPLLSDIGELESALLTASGVRFVDNQSLSTCSIVELVEKLNENGWDGDVCITGNLEDGCPGTTVGCEAY